MLWCKNQEVYKLSKKFSIKKIKDNDMKVLKWLLSIGKSQLGKVFVLIVVDIIGASLSIFFANFSKHIIDGATVYKDINYVAKYAIFMFILIVSQLGLSLLESSLVERCKGRLEMIFKQHMLDEVMKKDYSKVSKYHTGELQNRMFNDVTVVTDGITNIVPNIVYFSVKLICAFSYLVVIDKIFALFFLVGGIVVFLLMGMFRGTIKRLHKEVQETEGKTRSFIQEAVMNLLVVKSFVVEDKISKDAEELQEINYKAKMKRRFFSITANAGVSSVFSLGYVFAIVFGAYRLLNGAMTYGTVTAILQLVNQVQTPFTNLSTIMPKYYALIASGERLMEICNIQNEDVENETEIDVDNTYKNLKSISFNNVSFGYDRELILDNTSFDINKGDFIAIMGISGIGKSTILKLLLGVFKVENGEINLNLVNQTIPADNKTRKLFAYVPQGNMLLSGTIRENLTFINSDVTEEEINEAVRISCSKQFIDELPLGLETVIGEKGMGLSEGQLQRLAIARSLLSKSPVLLLDEATSALDEETEKQFLTNLKQMKNVTCIIVSHKKAALDICNKYVKIVDGKIVSKDNALC